MDRHNRVTVIPYQHPDAQAIYGVIPAEGSVSVWAVMPEGQRYRGAAAVNAVLSVALGTRLPWLIYRLPGMAWMQEWVYEWVARHRDRLPGDRPYCQQHPEDCGVVS
jgi:predicted DCC family thiol-disulfide oxidoreductase YuxK